MKICFNLTMYDKWDDLKTQVSIIRSWKHKYEIRVYCNHPNGKDIINKMNLDIDHLCVPTNPIPYTQPGFQKRKTAWSTKKELKKNHSFNLRAAQAVQLSNWETTEYSDADYIVQTHVDGFFLDEEALRGLIKEMERRGKSIACRGKGLELTFHPFRNCNAFGQVDDHALIYDRIFCEHFKVWDYKVTSMLYHKYSMHAMLGLVLGVKAGLDSIWWYRKQEDLFDLQGNNSSSLNPLSYDKEYQFLHVNHSTLPEGWGKKLQAHYLYAKGYNFMLKEKDDTVFKNIRIANDKYKWKMLFYGFPKHVRNNLSSTMKERFLEGCNLLTISKNYFHLIIKFLLDKMYKIPPDVVKYYENECDIDKFDNHPWTGGFY